MALIKFSDPKGETVNGPNGSKVSISWKAASHVNKYVDDRQKVLDSEVLRMCSPLVPHRSGALEQSGTLGTVIGSGEVKYTAPYARRQYYATAESRSYDPRRGARWFERMKTANKSQLERLMNR